MRHFLKSFRYNPPQNQYDVGALRYRLVDGWRRGLQIGLLNNEAIQRIFFSNCALREDRNYFLQNQRSVIKTILPDRLLLLLLLFYCILMISKVQVLNRELKIIYNKTAQLL